MASDLGDGMMSDETPARERAMTDAQRRWLEALAEHHGVEPDRIPELNASQAGALISKWAGSLPRKVRSKLGDQ
jgi:hypothetical protein